MKICYDLYNYLKQTLKKLSNIIFKKVERQNNDILDLNAGDIIFAKRYSSEEEKDKIPSGHQTGPFIVISKNDNELMCVSGTSTTPKMEYADMFIEFEDNGLNKKTFFKLNGISVVDKDTFIKKIGALKNEQLNKLYTGIKLHNKRDVINNLELPLQIGDIIFFENINYIILDIKESNLICVPIRNLTDNYNIDNFKRLNYSKTTVIDTFTDVYYRGTVSNNILIYVLKMQSDYLKYLKEQYVAQRGSIISKGEKLYYIYGELGTDWLVFEVFKSKKAEFDHIKVKNKTFYTNYYDEKLNKNDVDNVILLAYDAQKENIKLRKKNRKKLIASQVVAEEKTSLSLNDVIVKNDEEYIILEFLGNNMAKCIHRSDITKRNRQCIYLNVENTPCSSHVKKLRK